MKNQSVSEQAMPLASAARAKRAQLIYACELLIEIDATDQETVNARNTQTFEILSRVEFLFSEWGQEVVFRKTHSLLGAHGFYVDRIDPGLPAVV
jgi:hypothetical protein